MSSDGATTAFKLCVVVDTGDKSALEQQIYMEVDSDIPYDILLYTKQEWLDLHDSPNTFAHKIHTTGAVLYA